MQTVLDTNVLVRFFTNDIPAKAEQVRVLLEEEKNIYIPDIVFPELEYILLKKYGVKRKEVVEAYKFMIGKINIKTSLSVKKAISLYEITKLDMADCIISVHSSNGKLASFDKELLTTKGVKSYWEMASR